MAARTGPLRAWRSSRPRLHRVRHPANVSRSWIRRPSCRFKVDLLTPHAGADLPTADTGRQSFTCLEGSWESWGRIYGCSRLRISLTAEVALRLSAVGLAAIADPENLDGFLVLVETGPVITDAEAILGRVDALQPLHIAGAGLREALEGLFDAAGDTPIERRHILQRRIGPFDFLHSSPSRRMASKCGMPFPLRLTQSCAPPPPCLSPSVSGSSSMGALCRAAATGSTIVSSNPTSAETC